MRSKLATVLVAVGGVLMLLSACAHAFQGWPAMAEGLAPHPVDPEIAASLAVGWIWGSVCMAGLGALTLLSLPGLRRGERSAVLATVVAGLTWLAFGVGALIALNAFEVTRTAPYVVLGVFLWVAVLESGVHATLAGVLIGFTIPLNGSQAGRRYSPLREAEHHFGRGRAQHGDRLGRLRRGGGSGFLRGERAAQRQGQRQQRSFADHAASIRGASASGTSRPRTTSSRPCRVRPAPPQPSWPPP